MNADRRITYCHGAKMVPSSDLMGRSVDECIYCHRSVLIVTHAPEKVTRIQESRTCPVCGRPASAGRTWCRTHCNVATRQSA